MPKSESQVARDSGAAANDESPDLGEEKGVRNNVKTKPQLVQSADLTSTPRDGAKAPRRAAPDDAKARVRTEKLAATRTPDEPEEKAGLTKSEGQDKPAAQHVETPQEPLTPHATLTAELDRESLRQALLDFEVANARVLDLTQRLVESRATIAQLRSDLEEMRLDYSALQSQHHLVVTSRAYRIVDRLRAVKNALRP